MDIPYEFDPTTTDHFFSRANEEMISRLTGKGVPTWAFARASVPLSESSKERHIEVVGLWSASKPVLVVLTTDGMVEAALSPRVARDMILPCLDTHLREVPDPLSLVSEETFSREGGCKSNTSEALLGG